MGSGSPPKPPASLGKVGRKVWREIVGTYELEPHERRLIEEACGFLDRAAQLDEQVEQDGLIVKGSMGQPVLHPAVAEARQHRQAYSRLVGQLSFPDEVGRVGSSWSGRGRRGAAARWG